MTGFVLMMLATAWLVLDALVTILGVIIYCLAALVRGVYEEVVHGGRRPGA